MTTLTELLARVESATGADREIDEAVWLATTPGAYSVTSMGNLWPPYQLREFRYPAGNLVMVMPNVTSSLDAVIALIERVLPGFAWKVGTCCVSDDAWVAPDFNHPVHGARLRAEIGPITIGSPWDSGFDIDRRPSGLPALALLAAFLRAKIAMEEK